MVGPGDKIVQGDTAGMLTGIALKTKNNVVHFAIIYKLWINGFWICLLTKDLDIFIIFGHLFCSSFSAPAEPMFSIKVQGHEQFPFSIVYADNSFVIFWFQISPIPHKVSETKQISHVTLLRQSNEITPPSPPSPPTRTGCMHCAQVLATPPPLPHPHWLTHAHAV